MTCFGKVLPSSDDIFMSDKMKCEVIVLENVEVSHTVPQPIEVTTQHLHLRDLKHVMNKYAYSTRQKSNEISTKNSIIHRLS